MDTAPTRLELDDKTKLITADLCLPIYPSNIIIDDTSA